MRILHLCLSHIGYRVAQLMHFIATAFPDMYTEQSSSADLEAPLHQLSLFFAALLTGYPRQLSPAGTMSSSILPFDPQVHRPSVLITSVSPLQSIRFFFILLKITNRSPKWPACTCILIAAEQGGRIPTRNGGESKIRTTYTDRRGRDMRAVMTWPIDRV